MLYVFSLVQLIELTRQFAPVCGHNLANGAGAAAAADCSMACSGNSTEACGGPNRLNLFWSGQAGPSIVPRIGPYAYFGCQTEATNGRALTAKAIASNTMTLEACESACAGYTYFGTEYGSECKHPHSFVSCCVLIPAGYCGNSFSAGSNPAPATDCQMPCVANVSEYCGAGNRLLVYQLNATGTGTGTTPTATATAPSSTVSLPTEWIYDGCWVDGLNGRVLDYQQPDNQNNTVELCIAICSRLGFSIAGLEYGMQCFCDNFIQEGGALAVAQADCNIPCSGNSAQICGAGNRLSIYSVGKPVVLQPPVVQTTDLPGSWKYQACIQ